MLFLAAVLLVVYWLHARTGPWSKQDWAGALAGASGGVLVAVVLL